MLKIERKLNEPQRQQQNNEKTMYVLYDIINVYEILWILPNICVQFF